MFRCGAISFLVMAAVSHSLAADKPNRDIGELQRDVAQLQEMMKNLQQGLDARFAAVTGQIQSVADAVGKVDASVAALDKSLGQMAQDQAGKIVPAVAAQGSRIDQAAASLVTMQQATADLTAAVNKMQTQVMDLGNAVKVLASPAPPAPGTDKPPAAAADLLNNAEGDRSGGKLELALREYTDYLKWYSDTPMAHVAQFQIGMLHYALQDYESAVANFDVLLQQYPDSGKLPDALFYKRKSLQSLGRAADAAQACQELRKRFPSNDLAKQCAAVRR